MADNPKLPAPSSETPLADRACNLWGWNVLEAVFLLRTRRVLLPAGLIWSPGFCDHNRVALMKV